MTKGKGVLGIAWCDNGSVDTLFMSGILHTIGQLNGIPFGGFFNTIGNLIYKQRQDIISNWEESDVDWMLWVDSDVVLTPEIMHLLYQTADSKERPVVSGVYFVSPTPNKSLMVPIPCIFTDDGIKNTSIHPLPENQVIPIDVAGMGLVLMHRSILPKLKEHYKDGVYFDVTLGENHKSEDVSFFRKLKEVGIPVFAHTGAIAKHIKRFVLDEQYYRLWWSTVGAAQDNPAQEDKL